MVRRLRFWARVLLLGRIRLAGDDVHAKPIPLFVPEAAACVVATLLFFGARPAAPVDACGGREPRLAFVQRSYAAMGVSVSMISPRLREQIRDAAWVEDLASFRTEGATVYVSRNFFQMMGVQPASGRFFRADEPLASIVVPGGVKSYRAVGTLPAEFRFVSPWVREYAVLPDTNRPTSLLVLLKPLVSREAAEAELRTLLGSGHYKLAPYRTPVRWRDTVLGALGIAAVAFLLTLVAIQQRRTKGSAKYWGALLARLTLSVLALAQVATLFQLWSARLLWPVTVLHLWAFVTACVVLCWFTIRDHWDRCPVCLERVAMPARFGRWDSLLIDVPATEYVCPRGHGLLYVNEIGTARAKWTALDGSWRELFGSWKE